MKPLPALSALLPHGIPADPPLVSLLSANIITIVLAIAQNWDAAAVVFVYWVQSVIIGLFTVTAIADADTMAVMEDIEARHRERNEEIVLDPRRIRRLKFMDAGFFAIHYGIFHIAYYDFIITGGMFGPVLVTGAGIWLPCGIFFASHLYSFLYYRKRERRGENFVNDTFIGPYFRVIPMHLIVLSGALVILVLAVIGIESALPVLVVFLLLKTAADLAMHLWKHAGEY